MHKKESHERLSVVCVCCVSNRQEKRGDFEHAYRMMKEQESTVATWYCTVFRIRVVQYKIPSTCHIPAEAAVAGPFARNAVYTVCMYCTGGTLSAIGFTKWKANKNKNKKRAVIHPQSTNTKIVKRHHTAEKEQQRAASKKTYRTRSISLSNNNALHETREEKKIKNERR